MYELLEFTYILFPCSEELGDISPSHQFAKWKSDNNRSFEVVSMTACMTTRTNGFVVESLFVMIKY